MNEPIWTTHNGSKVKIRDLSDVQLVNAIQRLEMIHDENSFDFAFVLNDEFETDEVISALDDDGPAKEFPIFGFLMDEAKKRGMLPLLRSLAESSKNN